MKKFALVLAAALSMATLAPTDATARYAGRNPECAFSPYVGLTLGVHNVRFGDVSYYADYNAGLIRRYLSGELSLGMRNNMWGFEIFYRLTTNESRDGRVAIFLDDGTNYGWVVPRSRNSFQWEGWGANVFYQFPLRRGAAVEAMVGLGMYSGDINVIVYDDPATVFVDESVFSPMHQHWNDTLGVTLGLGFSQRVNRNMDFRGGLRYTMFSGSFLIDNDRSMYVGFRYVFGQ